VNAREARFGVSRRTKKRCRSRSRSSSRCLGDVRIAIDSDRASEKAGGFRRGFFSLCKRPKKGTSHAGFCSYGHLPCRADVSVALKRTIFWFFFQAISCCARQKPETTSPYESAGVRTFFASRSFISEALPSCRGAARARARHFASSVDAARVSEKHSRAQAFAHPSRAVRHPRLSPVCAHRASVARVARRGFRPVLPGVAMSRANAESHDTGNIPPESARGCRARAP